MAYDLTRTFDVSGLKRVGGGKTQDIYEDPEAEQFPGLKTAISVYKDVLTANNDPSQTIELPGVGIAKATANDAAMRMLKAAGFETAYMGRVAANAFRIVFGEMAMVEAVWHSEVTGSEALRNPHLPEGTMYVSPRVTMHVKSGGGVLLSVDGEQLLGGLTKDEEDAIIVDPFADRYTVRHQKRGLYDPDPRLVLLQDLDPAKLGVSVALMVMMYAQVSRAAVLDRAFLATFGLRGRDGKFEFLRDGTFADVYDLDSRRTQRRNPVTGEWESIDKDPLRKLKPGESREEVAKKALANYRWFAELVGGWQIPRQAVVFWRGSKTDSLPMNQIAQARTATHNSVDFVDEVASAHKTPEAAMERIQALRTHYPQGFVIITNVGRSNGAAPCASARSVFPVIAMQPDFTKPHELLSAIDVPSKTPTTGVLYPEQAISAALRMLAPSNMFLQAEIDLAIGNMVGPKVIALPGAKPQILDIRAQIQEALH